MVVRISNILIYVSVLFFFFFVSFYFNQGKKEIDELKVKLQDMKQLHELTLNEFQSLKSDYSDLSAEKVFLTYGMQLV